MNIIDVFLGAFISASILSVLNYFYIRNLQRTIDRQQDTINRLINREPVTYAETGQKSPKPVKEVYAAWGNQMINIDEDESRK